MSKKQLENTDQGRQLIAIEELSQQLENLFKDMEQIRRQNFLFQSYLMRLEKQQKKDYKQQTQQEKKKAAKLKKNLDRKNLLLTPQQKYQIAQHEAEALKQNIEKGRVKSDAILQTLRAILQETDMSIAQIRKDAYDFQRQILLGGQNSRTGKIQAQRIQKYFQEKQRQKKGLIEKYKNKKNTLTSQIIKTTNQIAKKEEMGDELKFIDFHQLQIENKKYVKQIEEKNDKLLDYKISSGKIGTQLLQAKKQLNGIVNQITKFQKDIKDKQRNIKQMEKNLEEAEEKRHKLNQKKKKLTTQAQQMKSPANTDIPNTMAYVIQKRTQQKLLYEKKNLERKILIAQSIYEKAKKTLGIV